MSLNSRVCVLLSLQLVAVCLLAPLAAFAGDTSDLLVIEGDHVGVGGPPHTNFFFNVSKTVGTSQKVAQFENLGWLEIWLTNRQFSKSWKYGVKRNNEFFIDTLSSADEDENGNPILDFILDRFGNIQLKGTLSQGSSASIKENFAPVDHREVLDRLDALAIGTWNYKHDTKRAVHIGPTAEAFREAFPLGIDDKHLAPADTAGVALAAAQGLNRTVVDQDQRIDELEQQNVRLARQVEALLQANEDLRERVAAIERTPPPAQEKK